MLKLLSLKSQPYLNGLLGTEDDASFLAKREKIMKSIQHTQDSGWLERCGKRMPKNFPPDYFFNSIKILNVQF